MEPQQNNDAKNSLDEIQQPKQSQPQTFQFQIPFQVPVQQPVAQQLVPPQAPQQLPNVASLVNGVTEATKEGNSSEAQVPSQIILISSAILTVVGVFALNTDAKKISWPIGVLLLIAVFGLGIALLAGVFHFTSERRFWYGNREKGIFALGVLSGIQNDADRDRAAALATNQMNPSSSRAPFYVQTASFTLGVMALLILVITEIVIKMHS